MLAVAGEERFGIWKVKPPREVSKFSFVFRQRVDLLVMKQLKRVFDFSEQQVSGGELSELISSKEVEIEIKERYALSAKALGALRALPGIVSIEEV